MSGVCIEYTSFLPSCRLFGNRFSSTGGKREGGKCFFYLTVVRARLPSETCQFQENGNLRLLQRGSFKKEPDPESQAQKRPKNPALRDSDSGNRLKPRRGLDLVHF